jgi:hypothetical protein
MAAALMALRAVLLMAALMVGPLILKHAAPLMVLEQDLLVAA